MTLGVTVGGGAVICIRWVGEMFGQRCSTGGRGLSLDLNRVLLGAKLTSPHFQPQEQGSGQVVKEAKQHLLYTMFTEEASFSDNLAGQVGDFSPMEQQQCQSPR